MKNMVEDIALTELELKNFIESLNIFDEFYSQEVSEANKRLDAILLEIEKDYNFYSYVLNKIENQSMKKRFQIEYDLYTRVSSSSSKSNFQECDDLIFMVNKLDRRNGEINISLSNKLKLLGKAKLKDELQNNETNLKKAMMDLFDICKSAEYEKEKKCQELKVVHEDRVDEFQRVYYETALSTFNDELLNNIIQHRNFSNMYKSNIDIDNIPKENSDNSFILGHLVPRWVKDFENNYIDYTTEKFGEKSTSELKNYLSTLYITMYRKLEMASTIIKYNDHEGKESANKIVNSYISSILLNLQSNKIKFTLFDPVSLGHTFSNLLKLSDYNSKIINDKVWVEKEHMRDKLSLIGRDIELIIQDYLRDEFEDIISYNNQNGYIREPYQFLVVSDFPSGFDDDMTEKLLSIMNNGPRCGIFTILMNNESFMNDQVGNYFEGNLSKFDTIEIRANGIFYNQNKAFDYYFDSDLTNLDMTDLLKKVGELSNVQGEIVRNSEVLSNQGLWSMKCIDELKIPIGIKGANKTQYFEVGQNVTHHALITGAIGSGKSVFLNTLIVNGSNLYHPDELNYYLIDFKEGVEFKPYVDNPIPHIKVVSIESEVEFALNVLQNLQNEMKHRGELFKSCKENIAKYSDYRKLGYKLPRIVLIIDEYQKLFEGIDAIGDECAVIINDLINRSRAFGIHLVLCSQAVRGSSYITSDVREQIGVRIAFKSLDGGNSGLADDNFIIKTLTKNPGHGIYNDNFGQVSGNNVFQSSYFTNEEKREYLLQNKNLADGNHVDFSMKVFDGSAEIPLLTSKEIEINRVALNLVNHQSDRIWIGEPVTMENDLSIQLSRESGSNVIIFGTSNDYLTRLFNLMLYSNKISDKKSITYIVDNFSKEIDNQLMRFQEKYDKRTYYGKGSKFVKYLNDIYEELNDRIENDKYSSESIYLYVLGIHKLKVLEDEYDPEVEEIYTKLKTILMEGPEYGVHTIFWSNNKSGLDRYIRSREFNQFDYRIALRVNADDSSEIIETDAAVNLKDGFAYLYNRSYASYEKFRIFDLEKTDWTKWMDGILQAKS